jgi:serine/threonine protein kinase
MGRASTSVPSGLNGDPLYPSGTNIIYEYVKPLGEGSYGQVAAVRSVNNGELYARKSFQYADEAQAKEMRVEVTKEVHAMRSLGHHHIASVNDWTQDLVLHNFSILVSPVGDGHLGQYLAGTLNGLSFGRQHDRWFGCLVTALCHAHLRGIIHQDIKPSNIIIKDNEPYLADFGAAKDFSRDDSSRSIEAVIKGPPNYMAPEDVPGVERGRATDVFSLGCVFAEMLTVRQGLSLDDFRTWRKRSEQTFPFAFRATYLRYKSGWPTSPAQASQDSSAIRL